MDLEKVLKQWKNSTEWLGLRSVKQRTQNFSVRNEKPESTKAEFEEGLMVEVLRDGHFGYAGTCDLSSQGIERAFERAVAQTAEASRFKVSSFASEARPSAQGQFVSSHSQSFDKMSLAAVYDELVQASQRMKTSERIINRKSQLMLINWDSSYLTSTGTHINQQKTLALGMATATAQKDADFQSRSLNGHGRLYQVGAEALRQNDMFKDCEMIASQAEELVLAPNCPSEKMDVIIAPDQMMLQIHESIGHPLELDRILGDERNYAGWSFVKLDDFGRLQYGSDLMNVTYDPKVRGQAASLGFDDGGKPAERLFLIQNGLLVRGLGAAESELRSKKPGVANFRASSWNRAPIDRMGNINLEPGSSSLDDMIASIDEGVILHTNKSWSIDDYRDKFQFGCEYALQIRNGKIIGPLKNANYRGRTLDFWRKLSMVGNDTEMYGTPYCGKGEPSQVIRVGHASPSCKFTAVEVFGGAT